MLLTSSLATLLKGNVTGRLVGIVLIILGVVELLFSLRYSKGVIKNGTSNGFAPASMAFSLFFGLILLVVGIFVVVATF
ncbi:MULTISPECIES: hypothetical protein [Lactobacillus]|uniref:hypothetical protein n=1 Tax=Lactobacillus TaxID=1578 RepID=UPI000EFC5B1A|nr:MULTISPECIES: hypothetical protein [Lactobacillus]RMC49832.1 hypothetical protein F5ESL0263_02125 [Lactobacillus sp. ESL0263]WLS85246.1 hypothetical protein RAM13_01945 [Lactobacillus apis]